MKWFYGLYPTDRIKIQDNYYYISDFFPEINIIFSIWILLYRCKSYYSKIKQKPFREVFSINQKTEVMVDSGAFGFYRSKCKNNINWSLKEVL